ncbi:hypothetical protein NRIC_35750 [Enterococcus florum]|uniref:Gram-positive cocci surface proteins LPxTG domain-containing protein n=1 Tax=Enterococcus florum TaxID=2480627 RepID=A0A4P5PFX7_9ENTE|nr:cell wall protein [Enterococcus florum]GCF95684.1 hypothetical protein NRIC_35750 [Enterococcus florum]
MYLRKHFAKIVCVLIAICGFSQASIGYAAEELPPGMVIGDEKGLYTTPEGDYFIEMEDVMPGETYKKTITIRSLDLKEPYSLDLRVDPVDSTGPIDFNKSMTMTLTLDDKEIYTGPLLGNGEFDWTKTPLDLGICKYGTDKVLKATFKMDKSLTGDDFKEPSEMTFKWTFVATRDQKPTKPTEETKDTPKLPDTQGPKEVSFIEELIRKNLPQTGEDWKDALYKTLSGLLLVLITILLWKKRKEEEANQGE